MQTICHIRALSAQDHIHCVAYTRMLESYMLILKSGAMLPPELYDVITELDSHALSSLTWYMCHTCIVKCMLHIHTTIAHPTHWWAMVNSHTTKLAFIQATFAYMMFQHIHIAHTLDRICKSSALNTLYSTTNT